MKNMYTYAKESSIPSVFPYSFIFSHYESLAQIRKEIYLLTLFMAIAAFLIPFAIFASLRRAVLIVSQVLTLQAGSLACLYWLHDLTFNFANVLWLYIVPVIFLDTLIHASWSVTQSKWIYNRVLLALIVSLSISSLFSIETYIFHMIRLSLLYQAGICFVLVNIVLPAWCCLIEKTSTKNRRHEDMTAAQNVESGQPLTGDTEVANLAGAPRIVQASSI